MWIDKKDKLFYNDGKYHGIRTHFYKNKFSDEKIKKIRAFCRRISTKYWFPIRCNIYFVAQKKFQSPDDGHTYYGIFYSNEEEKNKYPCVCVATEFETEDDEYECYFTIIHELTHYFQWYFYETDKRTSRSLEIEANKWARYLVEEYLWRGSKLTGRAYD